MISLIIPCFNEEESLPLFYPEATSVLRQMNCDYELIFVNDGSRDRTLEILKELSEKDPHVIPLINPAESSGSISRTKTKVRLAATSSLKLCISSSVAN